MLFAGTGERLNESSSQKGEKLVPNPIRCSIIEISVLVERYVTYDL
jgi:hypothetical protein